MDRFDAQITVPEIAIPAILLVKIPREIGCARHFTGPKSPPPQEDAEADALRLR